MLINLTGGPVGGSSIEVPDEISEFAIDIADRPIYNNAGQFLGQDPSYSGALYSSTADDMFASKRAAIWESIKAKRDQLQASGVKVGSYWFHSDLSSRIQQIGLVMMGAGIPAGLKWKTMTGEQVTMTQLLANQIFGATAQRDMVIFGIAEAKRKELNSMQDPTNYNIEVGWPETFTG